MKTQMKRKAEQNKAVALKYQRARDNAPRVVASGRGCTAQKIIDLAPEGTLSYEKIYDELYQGS